MAQTGFITIYQVTHIKSGKVYIGQTGQLLNVRWNVHLARAKAGDCPGMNFYNALRTSGRTGFRVKALSRVRSREDAKRLEEYFIIVLNADQEDHGYNMRGRQYDMPEAVRRKIGNSHRGIPKSPEHIAKAWRTRKARFN